MSEIDIRMSPHASSRMGTYWKQSSQRELSMGTKKGRNSSLFTIWERGFLIIILILILIFAQLFSNETSVCAFSRNPSNQEKIHSYRIFHLNQVRLRKY
jgi:hypothetical protein